MNRVTIKTTKRADKNLLKICKTDRVLFNKIKEAIDELPLNPFIVELKTGEYVLILLIGPRENFYEDLKRYLK